MIFISHRGNTEGPSLLENKPDYILSTLNNGYDVETDLWCIDNNLFLGHDFGNYQIDKNFLLIDRLWIHCKNIEALFYCKHNKIKNNYFYHQNDDVTLTSNGIFWTYPGKTLTKYSVAVMPEIKYFDNIDISHGICSDLIKNYK